MAMNGGTIDGAGPDLAGLDLAGSAKRRRRSVLAPVALALAALTGLVALAPVQHALAQSPTPSIETGPLDRRAAAPLILMGRTSKALCDDGNKRACDTFARLRTVARNMAVVQRSCTRGSPRACQLFEVGVAELARSASRFESAARSAGRADLPRNALSGDLFGDNGLFAQPGR